MIYHLRKKKISIPAMMFMKRIFQHEYSKTEKGKY